MSTVEKYLKPEVVRQIARLDLRAQFIVKGFLQGLHASPFHGFSVEFSEHRKYTPGDDPHDIDWLVYAKTNKYYVKKFEAETNITGYLAMDLSESMAYTFRQELTKFEYCICLAAALGYPSIALRPGGGLLASCRPAMADTLKLEPRTVAGSRTTRNLRREGLIPGILYGKGIDPVPFQVDVPSLRDAMGNDRQATMQVEVPGEGVVSVRVQAIQRDPVRDRLSHIDLLRQ